MAITFSKKTWSDTAQSGTALTAEDFNRIETVCDSLVSVVNELSSDTGWQFLYGPTSTHTFVMIRKAGKTCYMQWFFIACNQTKWTCPEKLPKSMWPSRSFCTTGADHGLSSNNVAMVYIEKNDGTIMFNDFLPSTSYNEGTISWVV